MQFSEDCAGEQGSAKMAWSMGMVSACWRVVQPVMGDPAESTTASAIFPAPADWANSSATGTVVIAAKLISVHY